MYTLDNNDSDYETCDRVMCEYLCPASDWHLDKESFVPPDELPGVISLDGISVLDGQVAEDCSGFTIEHYQYLLARFFG